MHITREAFAPKEKIKAVDHLIVLVVGVATRAGNIVTPGGHWGDIIVSSKSLRDTREAKALGYCEVASLLRDDLLYVMKEYPESAK